jgi:hypothetical protein
MPTGVYPRTKPVSLETRLKLSRIGKGHPVSAETRKKLGVARKGKRFTDEWKKNIGDAARGRKHSSETRAKMSKSQKGKRLSPEHREKLRASKRGSKNPQWKGGVTPVHLTIRKSIEYKLWRRSVLERDNYTCIWCESKKQLEADHIKPFASYPELRFAIDNGRTLCRKCHQSTSTWGTNHG